MDEPAVGQQVGPGPVDVEVLQQRSVYLMKRGITFKEAVYSRILFLTVRHNDEATAPRWRQWVDVKCQHPALLGATHQIISHAGRQRVRLRPNAEEPHTFSTWTRQRCCVVKQATLCLR